MGTHWSLATSGRAATSGLDANIRDPGGSWWQWEPAGGFLRRAIELREWPLWDPYVAAGTPAMANLTPAFFFPPYTAMIALGGSVQLKNVYLLCLIWASAFFTFLFLRRHGLLFLSALGGAAALMVGGAVNQNIGTIMGQTASCLPLCLYVTRVFLDDPTPWKTVAVTLVYAATALASFPPILLGLFGVVALYVLVALLLEHRGAAGGRSLASSRWAVGVVLSIGLVCFYYVPVMALRAHTPYVSTFYEGAGLETMPLAHAYQLLSPTLMGGPLVYVTSPVPAGDMPHLNYVGMAVLLLALLARPGGDSRSTVLFYASAAGSILILLKLFGVPPVQWLGNVPILKQIHFAHYFGVHLGFLVSFLAALGVESLLRGTTAPIRVLTTAVAGLIMLESLWWAVEPFQVLKSTGDTYWLRDWRVVNGVACGTAIALLAGTLARQWRHLATVCIVALIAVEGTYNSSYPSPDAWDMFAHPAPYVQELQRGAAHGRVLPFGALTANLNSAFEILQPRIAHGVQSSEDIRPVHSIYQGAARTADAGCSGDSARARPRPCQHRFSGSSGGISTIGSGGEGTRLLRPVQRRVRVAIRTADPSQVFLFERVPCSARTLSVERRRRATVARSAARRTPRNRSNAEHSS